MAKHAARTCILEILLAAAATSFRMVCYDLGSSVESFAAAALDSDDCGSSAEIV